jgi:16S rRNA (guanine527-N7)-methyltransferase
MDKILKYYHNLEYMDVSRETCLDFEEFIFMMLKKNKNVNLISKKNLNMENIRERHVIDSAQIIDFIDFNYDKIIDLGSGAGFPGIIVAIMIKHMKKKNKIKLLEKSYHKSLFLKEVSRKLNLDTEIVQKDIFETEEQKVGTIITRAFKPLPIILDLVNKKFSNFNNLILFMGNKGKETLERVLCDWDIDYDVKQSITSQGSFLLNINNIKKK